MVQMINYTYYHIIEESFTVKFDEFFIFMNIVKFSIFYFEQDAHGSHRLPKKQFQSINTFAHRKQTQFGPLHSEEDFSMYFCYFMIKSPFGQ